MNLFSRRTKRFCHRSEDRLRHRQFGEPGPGHVQVPLDGTFAYPRLGLARLCRSRGTSRMGIRLNTCVNVTLWPCGCGSTVFFVKYLKLSYRSKAFKQTFNRCDAPI